MTLSAEAMAVDASPSPQSDCRGLSCRLTLVAELYGHDGRCWGLDWSPEGDTLASCGADRTVRTWHQLRSGGGGGGGSGGEGPRSGGGRWAPDAVLEESQARAVRAVAWAPPAAAAAAAAAAAGASSRSQQRQQRHQRRRRRRRRLAAASFDASVAVWEEERPASAASGEGDGDDGENDDGNDENDGDDDEPTLWSQVALLQGHESEVKGVAWSPLPGVEEAESEEEEEEEEAERGENDDDRDGKPPPPSPSSSVPLLADGEGCLLATCGRDRSVWLWESVPSVSGGAGGVGGGGSPCEFECVDVKQGHAGDVKSVSWHPSGSVLVSTSYDGTVRLWVPEGGASEEGAGGGGGAGSGGAGGGSAAAAAVVGDEWLCGQEVEGAHAGETVWSFAFEPRRRTRRGRGKYAAVRGASCGGDGRVSVWSCPLPSSATRPSTAEALAWRPGAVARSRAPPPLGGRMRPAYSVDWSRCGRWIASGGGDDCVRVFRAPPPRAAEGEEEGKKREGEEEVALELAAESRPSPACEVNCVKWRPQRRQKKNEPPMLAAACDDGVVRLWRLEEAGGEKE